MNARFAALLLLALAPGLACAQNLRRDPAVQALTATRDIPLGQTTITGSYTNNSQTTLPAPKVVFALYDANEREVGRITQRASTDLAPGQTWDIRATTPLAFTRYVPMTEAPPPVLAAPTTQARATKKAISRPVVSTAVARPQRPASHPKPELYDWSKHRRPPVVTSTNNNSGVPNGNTGNSVQSDSSTVRISPAIRPGYRPRPKPGPGTRPPGGNRPPANVRPPMGSQPPGATRPPSGGSSGPSGVRPGR